jgi:4-diphosphocytidyl-2-C-methyl-D-erythritol kinase
VDHADRSRVTRTAHVAAQAKINLFLDVLEREPSGYHGIVTAFLRIDLADDMTVSESSGRSLDVTGPALPSGGLGPTEKNLAYRAAAAYSDAAGWPRGFSIELVKRIPAGGGLGGASADAGAVLRALEAMSPKPLGPRLFEIAATLGADVPFMTLDGPMALGSGRGDQLKPIPALEPRPLVLAVPPFAISTADAYAWLDTDRAALGGVLGHTVAESLATWDDVSAAAHNDFELVVSRRYPAIATILGRFRGAKSRITMLSGSGSTVFGVFDDLPDLAAVGLDESVRAITTWTSDRVERVTIDQ